MPGFIVVPYTYGMQRILEPELMDQEAEAAAYARADFSDSNQWYVDRLVQDFPDHLSNIVDLGCGPADVPIRLACARPTARITAVDGSNAMLKLAEAAINTAGFQDRITLHLGRLPGLALPEHSFDTVLSKDMLHHLPDPAVLWSEIARLARPGAAVCVMDLIRPASQEQAREIVERVSGNEDPLLKQDFFNSLCAAFTVDEVRAQLQAAGLPLAVDAVTDRHMRISGLLR